MKILLVVPCYNEKQNIFTVINGIEKELEKVDYLVVDDGSTDGTTQLLKANKINYISLHVNCGLKAAFQAGVQWAVEQPIHYDAVCQFDADGQHIPRYIPEMEDLMEWTKADVVIASRYKDKNRRILQNGGVEKWFARTVLQGLIHFLTGNKITDPTSGLRMYKDTVYPLFVRDDNLGPEPDSIVYFLKKQYRVEELAVKMNPRIFGESYLIALEPLRYMFYMISSMLFIQWWR